jgi:hypothetical protein
MSEYQKFNQSHLLKNSDVGNDMKAFEKAKKELKEILEVE